MRGMGRGKCWYSRSGKDGEWQSRRKRNTKREEQWMIDVFMEEEKQNKWIF